MGRTTKWTSLFLCALVVLVVGSILDAGALYFLSSFLLLLPLGTWAFGTLSVRTVGATVHAPLPTNAGDMLELEVDTQNLGVLPRFNITALVELPGGLSAGESGSWVGAGPLSAAQSSLPTDSNLNSKDEKALHPAAPEGPGPLDGQVSDQVSGQVSVLVPFIPGSGHASARCAIRTERRGCFQVGPLSLAHMDPLGLSEVRRRLSARYEVLVYPRPLGISLMPLLGGDLAGSERTARNRGSVDGADFYGVRPYRAGDEWRRIHWKTTARVGQLMVVEREELATLSLVVVVDMAATAGDTIAAPLEVLVSLAAQLAEDAMRRMTMLDLVVLGRDGAISSLLSRCGDRNRAMEALARLDPEAELPSAPASSLSLFAGMGPSVVLLTDRLDERVASIAETCRSCAWPGAVVLLASGNSREVDPGPVAGVLPIWKLTPIPSPDGDPRKSDYDVEPLARL